MDYCVIALDHEIVSITAVYYAADGYAAVTGNTDIWFFTWSLTSLFDRLSYLHLITALKTHF